MGNSIEEDIAKVNTYIELVLEKDYCNCNELNTILGKHCDGSKNVAYAIEHILSEYKKVLKENEILKEEKEQAWEEWNNLEQGSYETEQKLKQQIKELRKENEELNYKLHSKKIALEIYNRYIPKSKVEEKIGEIQKEYEETLKTELKKKDKIIDSIKEYAQQEIDFATEDIKDYIDDDREGNKDIIGELKEWREHWKDIIRIMNNEKTYIDFEYKVEEEK